MKLARFADELSADLRHFLHLETTAGVLLLSATALAMLVKNSPLAELYGSLLMLEGQVRVGSIDINKAVFLWVNDGWMAVFFFLVGLELKYEALHGHLRDLRQVLLPTFGALGGVVVPALIYVAFNYDDPVRLTGWAIPTATDIAFSLGVLAMIGSRVPVELKVFLMTLAIIDDLIAILMIAFFYTSGLSAASLVAGAVLLVALLVLNRLRVHRRAPYVLLGIVLWVCVLKSGVHATLAGVAIALLIPDWSEADGRSSLRALIDDLHPWVAWFILPGFAFVNAGIDFSALNPGMLLDPVPLGIATALVLGKLTGVFGFAWAAVRLGLGSLPRDVDWQALAGVALLCGIGFTMSLFIGGLAFAEGGVGYGRTDRLGILLGSFVSALAGYAVLRHRYRPRASEPGQEVLQ